LTAKASQMLNMLGYKNVKYKVGDGKLGWKEFAPFDAIIITAANKEIPPRLLQQLKTGGRLILPLKTNLDEYLYLANKNLNGELEYTQLCGVRFVPLL
jgi:protein-L-isoaspartate(D-aspartate) O-methyltransferase